VDGIAGCWRCSIRGTGTQAQYADAERSTPMNEADTRRKYVVPKLQAAGWENEPRSLTA
jgi:hypothetical protein